MPLNMAMEEPDTRIVGSKSHNEMAVGSDKNDVSSHGLGRIHHGSIGDGLGIKVAGLFLTTENGLEGVAVQMEWMLARILVVQDDFDDAVVLQHE